MEGRELWKAGPPGLAVCGLSLVREGATEFLTADFGSFCMVVGVGV